MAIEHCNQYAIYRKAMFFKYKSREIDDDNYIEYVLLINTCIELQIVWGIFERARTYIFDEVFSQCDMAIDYNYMKSLNEIEREKILTNKPNRHFFFVFVYLF